MLGLPGRLWWGHPGFPRQVPVLSDHVVAIGPAPVPGVPQSPVVLLRAGHVLEHVLGVDALGRGGASGEVAPAQDVEVGCRRPHVTQLVAILAVKQLFVHSVVEKSQGVLEAGVHVVSELAGEVHTGAHGRRLGLHVPAMTAVSRRAWRAEHILC